MRQAHPLLITVFMTVSARDDSGPIEANSSHGTGPVIRSLRILPGTTCNE